MERRPVAARAAKRRAAGPFGGSGAGIFITRAFCGATATGFAGGSVRSFLSTALGTGAFGRATGCIRAAGETLGAGSGGVGGALSVAGLAGGTTTGFAGAGDAAVGAVPAVSRAFGCARNGGGKTFLTRGFGIGTADAAELEGTFGFGTCATGLAATGGGSVGGGVFGAEAGAGAEILVFAFEGLRGFLVAAVGSAEG